MAPVKCIGVMDCIRCVKLGCKFAIFKKAIASCVVKMKDLLDEFAVDIEKEDECPHSPPSSSHFPWIYVGVGVGAAVAIGGIAACTFFVVKRIRARRRHPTRPRCRIVDGYPLYEFQELYDMLAPNERPRDECYPNTPTPTSSRANALLEAAAAHNPRVVEPLLNFFTSSEESLFKKTK